MSASPSHLETAAARLVMPALGVLVVAASIGLLATPYPALAMAPPLALLGGLFLFAYPAWGYLAIVAMIPFGVYRGPLHFVVAAGLVGVIAIRHLRERAPAGQMRANLWPWLLAFLCWMLLSALASPFGFLAIENYRMFLLNYAFFALHLYFASERATRHTIPVVLVGCITLGAALAIVGFYLELPWFVEDNEAFIRGSGGSFSAPALALSILYATPFLVFWLVSAPRGWMRALAALSIPIHLLAMITTYSRGGALVLVLLAVLLFLEHVRAFQARTLVLLAGAAPLVLLMGYLIVPASYWDRQTDLADPQDFSVRRRATYLLVARDAFVERPLLGYGQDTFGELYALSDHARALKRKSQDRLFRRAHNTYVEAAIGGGAVGLACFLGMVGTAIWNLTHARRLAHARGDPQLAGIAAAYRLALLALLVYFLVFSNLDNKYLILSLPLSWRVLQLARGNPTGDHA